jgi:RNA polymerase sigma factor (sigma-70 family)
MQPLEEQLLKELDTFTAFARRRVGDPHLAADIVQDSLLKAVKSASQLRDGESVTAWFYRILRRTIIDLYRRRAAAQRVAERLERELNAPADAEETRTACACVEALIPALNPEYAELIRLLDLDGRTPEQVAAAKGVTANNLRVRHHRARQQLRARLEETCRLCARHGCLDCTCAEDGKR